MSKLLGDTAVAAAQTSAKWQRAVGPVRNQRSRAYSLRPAVPPEKKWLYKQVLDSVQSGIAPEFNLGSSTFGRATSKVWAHLNFAHGRAVDIAAEYHVKERLTLAIHQIADVFFAVKNFIIHRQYHRLDGLIDRGLLALEHKIRATRENLLQHEESTSPSVKRSIASCTMIMLKRDPSVAVEYRICDLPKPVATTTVLDKSQRPSP